MHLNRLLVTSFEFECCFSQQWLDQRFYRHWRSRNGVSNRSWCYDAHYGASLHTTCHCHGHLYQKGTPMTSFYAIIYCFNEGSKLTLVR